MVRLMPSLFLTHLLPVVFDPFRIGIADVGVGWVMTKGSRRSIPDCTVVRWFRALWASRCYIEPASLMGCSQFFRDSHWELSNITFFMSSILFLPALDISPSICFQKLSLLASGDLFGDNLNQIHANSVRLIKALICPLHQPMYSMHPSCLHTAARGLRMRAKHSNISCLYPSTHTQQ